jgi:hypothetical protein
MTPGDLLEERGQLLLGHRALAKDAQQRRDRLDLNGRALWDPCPQQRQRLGLHGGIGRGDAADEADQLTIDLARAQVKIGLANLVYNMQRFFWLSGKTAEPWRSLAPRPASDQAPARQRSPHPAHTG